MELRSQPMHVRAACLLAGRFGVIAIGTLLLAHTAALAIAGPSNHVALTRGLMLACHVMVMLMAWSIVATSAEATQVTQRIRELLAVAMTLWCGTMSLSYWRDLGGINVLTSNSHILYLLGELLIIRATLLVPKRSLEQGERANEAIDLACLLGVVLSLMWGALDHKIQAFLASKDATSVLLIALHLGLALTAAGFCYWSIVRRETSKVNFLPAAWLLVTLLILTLRNTLQIRVAATGDSLERSISLHAVAATALTAGLALHSIGKTNQNEHRPFSRFARIPRPTVVLWISLAWVAVAVALLLRKTINPEAHTQPWVVATMGLGVLLLVAVRQGRNITSLIRLRDALNASNTKLEHSNAQLKILNRQIEEKAAREVNQLSARVEQLYEHTPWGICFFGVDPAAGFLFESMNPALEQRYGITRSKASMDYLLTLAGPEEAGKMLEALSHCAKTRETVELDSEIAINDQLRHSHITLIPIGDDQGQVVRIAGYLRDITSEFEALAALRQSEDKFRKVFRTCPEGIVLTDFETGRIIETNEQFMRLIGHNAEELVGMPTTDLGIWESKEARATVMELLEKSGRITEHETTLRGTAGNQISCLFSAELIEVGGRRRVLSFFKDMTLRRMAEEARIEAAHREQRLHEEYTVKLIRAQEAERARIAGDLHDGIGQEMLVIRNRLQMVSTRDDLPEALRGEVAELCLYALNAVREVRRLSHDLRPYQLDHLGLSAVVRSIAEAVAKAANLRIDLHVDDIDDSLDPDSATSLYRIVQECLNNVVKHACASELLLHVDRDLRDITVRIEDNGRGFDTLSQRSGLGMGNLHERAKMLKATLTVESTPGAGTKLRLVVPIEAELTPRKDLQEEPEGLA